MDGDIWRHLMSFKMIVAYFEIFPEFLPFMSAGLPHTCGVHSERKDVNAEIRLSVFECGITQTVDFVNFGIGHGEATDGDIGAVHHDVGACSAVSAIVLVGETYVESEVIGAVWIHASGWDEIEAFRHLEIAFRKFGAKVSAGGSDGIGAEEFKHTSFMAFQIELEFTFFFESADENWCATGETFLVQSCVDGFR